MQWLGLNWDELGIHMGIAEVVEGYGIQPLCAISLSRK